MIYGQPVVHRHRRLRRSRGIRAPGCAPTSAAYVRPLIKRSGSMFSFSWTQVDATVATRWTSETRAATSTPRSAGVAQSVCLPTLLARVTCAAVRT